MLEKAIKTSVKDFVIVCTCSFCDSVAFITPQTRLLCFLCCFYFLGKSQPDISYNISVVLM